MLDVKYWLQAMPLSPSLEYRLQESVIQEIISKIQSPRLTDFVSKLILLMASLQMQLFRCIQL
jgi:hypothetical protein